MAAPFTSQPLLEHCLQSCEVILPFSCYKKEGNECSYVSFVWTMVWVKPVWHSLVYFFSGFLSLFCFNRFSGLKYKLIHNNSLYIAVS